MQKNNGLTNTTVWSFAGGGNAVFTGTYGSIYLSTDNGDSWMLKDNGMTSGGIHSLAVAGNTVFAGTWGGGVFVSTNNGDSWIKKNNKMMNTTYVWSLAVAGSIVFAGTSAVGVFISTDNGNSWIRKDSNGLTNNFVFYSLAVSGNTIYAGTWGGGVFKSSFSDLGITAIEELPSSLDGIAISPNPASASFTISGIDGVTSVKIFTSLGMEVKQLSMVNGQLSIDVSDLASGVYFVQFRSQTGVISKPIVVSR